MTKEALLKMGLSEEQSDTLISLHNESLSKAKIEMGVENALLKHKARNLKSVLALIDFDKITDGENGISGIEEQIEQLKNSDETSFLFDDGIKKITGTPPEDGKDRTKPKNPKKMTYTEMCKYM